MFRVEGSGFRVQGWGLGFRVWGHFGLDLTGAFLDLLGEDRGSIGP